jgi:small subunit ribosomal protein S4
LEKIKTSKRNTTRTAWKCKEEEGKKSEYATQLMEAKAKYTYGILERQFSNLLKAQAASGITGEILYNYVNLVLDNVVYRMGVSNSRSGLVN